MAARIVILTTDSLSGFVSNRVLLDRYADQIAAVVLLPDVPRRLSHDGRRLRRLARSVPWPVLLHKAYDTVGFRLCRRLAGLPTTRSQARGAGIRLYAWDDPNSASAHAALRALDPDVIVNSSPSILAPTTLRMARRGCLNLHAAPLPEFAGVANHFWLLIEQSAWSGASVHEMTTTIDAGRLLSRKVFAIRPHDTVNSLNVMNCHLCSLAAVEALARPLEPRSDGGEPAKVTYRSFPTRPDVGRLRRLGRRIFSPRDVAAIWSETGLRRLTDEANARIEL